MNVPGFLKKKRTYLFLLIVLGGGWYFFGRGDSAGTKYETALVEQRNLVQTVEVTGEIKPAARIELAFKNSGTIEALNVRVGDAVKQGTVLAQLSADDVKFTVRSARATLSTAVANLNARIAGETKQSIRVAETQVEQAKAAYDKAVADLASTKLTTQDTLKAAEIALQTAKNNLDNQAAIIDQNSQNSIDSARVTLLTALGPLNSGLSDGDQISGVDNTAANQSYVNVLGVLDSGSLPRSKASYQVARDATRAAETQVKALTSASSKDAIQAAAEKLQAAITLVQAYLGDVQKVLAGSLTNAYLTESVLASKKLTIDSDRTSVSAQNTSVLNALQLIKNTELSKTQTIAQLQDAYTTAQTTFNTAKTNVDVQVRTAETNVAIQLAALDSARATLDLKKSGPRDVDLAPLRAAVEQASVTLEKAENDLLNVQIIAPVDGTISEVLPDIGELATAGAISVKMIGTQSYDIEAQVPEADVAKIIVGQRATITLDAYGDDVKFSGTVIAKDPAETRVQDAIYYKIRVQIDPAEREVKPGMTANVTVNTGERNNVLVIPLRAVRTQEDGKTKIVRVLTNNAPVETVVELGMRGDEGRVEVLSGLQKDQNVIVGEITAGISN